MQLRNSFYWFTMVTALCCCSVASADIFNGNDNEGFGGSLGAGSLEIVDNCDETLTFCLDLASSISNNVIIYLDTQAGGFSSTGGFTDNGDPIRTGISNFNGNPADRTTIDFASGFNPDFAIGADSGFQGLWGLENGPGSHNFVTGGSAGGTKYTFTVSFADLGISQGDTIQFGVTQTSATGFLSDETISGPDSTGFDSGSNPGFGSQVTLDSLSFTTKPVPEPSAAVLLLAVSTGFLGRRRRRS